MCRLFVAILPLELSRSLSSSWSKCAQRFGRLLLTLNSDWISLTVLRAVALSTNSVAASVEPVMQQQFLSMSPMAGQETFPGLDRGPGGIMGLNTPTTTSMLATLSEPFSTTANGNPFSPTSFFMETSPTSNGDSFVDFQPGRADPFDPSVFSQELGLPNLSTSAVVGGALSGGASNSINANTGGANTIANTEAPNTENTSPKTGDSNSPTAEVVTSVKTESASA